MTTAELDRLIRIALATRLDPSTELTSLVSALGPAQALEQAAAAPRQPLARPTTADALLRIAESTLDTARRAGWRYITPASGEWPEHLRTAGSSPDEDGFAAPIGLWLSGPHTLNDLMPRSIAITGGRAATRASQLRACSVGRDLADAGYCVSTGASLGVEAYAHQMISDESPELVVMATGFTLTHPTQSGSLLRRIARTGLLVTPYGDFRSLSRSRLDYRQHLLGALCAATLVMDCPRRSSSLLTAHTAKRLGRPTMAMYDDPTVRTVGTENLVRDGVASRVHNVADITQRVPKVGGSTAG